MDQYRVLRIMHRMSISGPTFHAAYLTKYLNKDFQSKLVSGMVEPTEKDGTHIMNEIGIEPTYLKKMKRSINPIDDYATLNEIRSIIREYKPHIVHTHAAKSGALGRMAASLEKVPIILHTFHGHVFHSYFGKLKSQGFLSVERYLAKKSSRIIAISQKQKEELGEVFQVCHPDKIEVIPLGFDLDKFMIDRQRKRAIFRKEFGLSDEEVAVGIIGRVTKVKNHPHFIKSFKQLVDKSEKPVKGFIVGDGDMLQECKNLAKELGLSISNGVDFNPDAQLYFTSWREDIDQVINGLDILTLTSLNEGTPVTLIEAQACQKPIISTRVGGIVDIVKENQTALLTEKEDIEGFSEKLLYLVEHPEVRKQMGKSGGFVYERFSHKRLVNDIENLYYQLLKEKGLLEKRPLIKKTRNFKKTIRLHKRLEGILKLF